MKIIKNWLAGNYKYTWNQMNIDEDEYGEIKILIDDEKDTVKLKTNMKYFKQNKT